MRLVQARTRTRPEARTRARLDARIRIRPDARTLTRLASRAAHSGGAAAVCLSLTLVVAGCHMFGTSSASGQGQKITVAAVPGFDSAPLQVAVRDRMFAQHGVTVTVQNYPTLGKAFSALASGRANVISGDYASLLYEQAIFPRARLRLIADGYDAVPGVIEVLTLPGSRITTPEALQGQVVATPQPQLAPYASNRPYNIETLTTDSALESDGVSPSSITWKPMPPGNMIRALGNHTVSAIVATEPYILQAETRLGAVELLDSTSGVTASLPLSGYFTTAGYASGHAAGLHAFQTALNQAKAESAAMPGTVQAVVKGLPGMTAHDATLVTLGQYPSFLSAGQIQRVADLMYSSGMIQTTIDVKGLVFH